MAIKREGKISFLKAVLENRDELFGAFTDKITKQSKTEKWKKMHQTAISLGLVPAFKSYMYTRDTYWQNLKKYTMKKIDNSKKTGTGGGPECRLTEIDNIILDIVGRDSPAIIGISGIETWIVEPLVPNQLPPLETSKTTKTDATKTATTEDVAATAEMEGSIGVEKHARSRKRRKLCDGGEEDEAQLRQKKLKLSIQLMEKESHLKTLSIIKMERDLELPPSKFSRDFLDNISSSEYE